MIMYWCSVKNPLDILFGVLIFSCCAYLLLSTVFKDHFSFKVKREMEQIYAHKHTFDPAKSSEESAVINTILKTTMDAMGADRAYVFQFHNGSYNLANKEFYYYSNTHETTAPGISPEILTLQRLPISLLAPTWMPKLLKNDVFFLKTTDEIHPQSREILKAQGIPAVMIARLM